MWTDFSADLDSSLHDAAFITLSPNDAPYFGNGLSVIDPALANADSSLMTTGNNTQNGLHAQFDTTAYNGNNFSPFALPEDHTVGLPDYLKATPCPLLPFLV